MEKRRRIAGCTPLLPCFSALTPRERESRSGRECGLRAAQDHQVLRREEDELSRPKAACSLYSPLAASSRAACCCLAPGPDPAAPNSNSCRCRLTGTSGNSGPLRLLFYHGGSRYPQAATDRADPSGTSRLARTYSSRRTSGR